MGFIDEVKLYLKAGDGGDGCASFRSLNLVVQMGSLYRKNILIDKIMHKVGNENE